MRKVIATVVFGFTACAIVLTGAPASAWEFSMSGELVWRYQTFHQGGDKGFFGPYDVDTGAGRFNANGFRVNLFPQMILQDDYTAIPGDFASFNGWLGSQVGDLASGNQASRQSMFMRMNMQVRVNRAIAVQGQYYVGSYEDKVVSDLDDYFGGFLGRTFTLPGTVRSQYLAGDYAGVQRAFSPGYWNTLWATIQLPWGTMRFGKRPFSFGTGMMLDGESNTSTEALSFAVPYGPMRFGILWYPFRRASKTYYNPFDDNGRNAADIGAFFVYESGPLSVGVLGHYMQSHIGPEAAGVESALDRSAVGADLVTREWTNLEDTGIHYGAVYLKYFNGRFFFNSEVAWYSQRTTRNIPRGIDTTDEEYFLPTWPLYVDQWRFMTELGAVVGPGKLSLLYAWVTGPEVRHGIPIDRSGALPIRALRNVGAEDLYDDFEWLDPIGKYRILPVSRLTNTSVFRPYSLIMVYNYGLGTDVSDDSKQGWVQDASCIGARIDYAFAANLNLFGSFFHARRTTTSGYTWGYLRPSLKMDGSIDRSQRAPNNGDYINNPVPTIPDPDLGYEVDVGFNWKLLEGLTFDATFGFWQPGQWFKYACIHRGIPGWGLADNAVRTFGISPDRTIDSIWGMEFNCTISF